MKRDMQPTIDIHNFPQTSMVKHSALIAWSIHYASFLLPAPVQNATPTPSELTNCLQEAVRHNGNTQNSS